MGRSALACLCLHTTAAVFYGPNTAFEQWGAKTQPSSAIQQMLLFKSHISRKIILITSFNLFIHNNPAQPKLHNLSFS